MYCYNLNIEAVGSWFQKIFESYSLLYGKSMEAKDPEGLAKLEPRGLIYVGDHQTLLNTNYISCGPYRYGIEDV